MTIGLGVVGCLVAYLDIVFEKECFDLLTGELGPTVRNELFREAESTNYGLPSTYTYQVGGFVWSTVHTSSISVLLMESG